MRHALRGSVAVSVGVLFSLSASSCSSGSDPGPAPGCTRAAIPASGPGDALDYFPSAVGWTWTNRMQSNGQLVTTSVTGTQPVGGESASVFTTTDGIDTIVEWIVERPAGAYVLADPSVTPPDDQLYPDLVLPFPVAVVPTAEQLRCNSLDSGQVDGYGNPILVDVTVTLQVVSVTEDVQVEAGTFAGVAHVVKVAAITARSKAASVQVTLSDDDWFAAGVGRVKRVRTATSPGYLPETESYALVSAVAPVTPAAKTSLAGRLAPAAAGRAPGLAEVAVARALIALGARP